MIFFYGKWELENSDFFYVFALIAEINFKNIIYFVKRSGGL